MLASFTVSNYRSFDEAVRFSMEAGKTRSFAERTKNDAGQKLLKFKAIYGANASGKSNLVRAIDFMSDAVLSKIPASSMAEFCKMKVDNERKVSLFQIEVVLSNARYVYGFEIVLNTGKFVREYLTEFRGNRSKPVFFRDIANGQYDVTSYTRNTSVAERLEIYAEDIRNDSSVLFLKSMNQNKNSLYSEDSPIMIYRELFRWFQNKLSINHPDTHISNYSYFFDSQNSAEAEKLLSRFDTGISGVEISEEAIEKLKSQLPNDLFQEVLENLNRQKKNNQEKGRADVPAVLIRSFVTPSMYIVELVDDDVKCKTIKFHHKHSMALFSLDEESDGTIRLMDLLEILLSQAKNAVYIVDEMNRCLHAALSRQFIKDFLQLAKERDIQLVITTHETNLMDLDVLRKDEIGFVVKSDRDGTSSLSSLEDFGARFDKRIRRAYLEGDYGAIPVIRP